MKLLSLPATTIVPTRHPLVFASELDRREFHSYPPAEQERVREMWHALCEISAARSVHAGAQAVAAQHGGRPGWSWKRLTTLHGEWIEAGRDWRALIDVRAYPEARTGRNGVLEDWLIGELVSNQRKFAPAIKAIQARWRRWHRTGDVSFAIPGLETCPVPDAGYLPRVFLEHNLRRVLKRSVTPATIEIIRYGTHAARKLLPHIPGTRDGVRWLEYVSGDDVELDVAAYVPGYGKSRILQFGFWEMSCSYYLEDAFIQRPRTPKTDGSWEKLKRRDFLFAVAILIERYGWPLDWTMHLLCERGTATMSRAEAQWLHEISGGQIVVGYSSMEGEFVAAWEERKGGNSRAKAGHEGFHGILKNEMGHLRGQQGMDRDHAPALDYGREKLTNRLDNVVVQLPTEDRGRVIAPYLTMPQVWRETLDALRRIHGRHDHECEGFERIIEWRPRGFAAEPRPLADLEDFLRQNPRLREEDVELFDRAETRAERKARLSAEGRFMAPPPAVMVPFYEDNCELRKIGADYSFSFEKDGRKYRFVPPTPDDRLPPGEKVVGFYRPDGEVLHLFSGVDGKNRRYLLSWPSEKRLRRDADAETKAAYFSRKQQFFNHEYARAAKATRAQFEQVQAEAEGNALVIAEHGLLPANVQRGCTPAAAAVQGLVEDRRRALESARTKRAAALRESGSLSDLLGEGDAAPEAAPAESEGSLSDLI